MPKTKKPRGGSADQDPYRVREARKYANPIPSREFILALLEENAAPLRYNEIAERLALTDEEPREALSRRLRAMERDGQVVRNRRDGYCVVNTLDLVAGRVIGHPDGFGFLKPDEGGDDLFLSARQMKPLWHGDRIVARVTGLDNRGRREGAVVEILERGVERLVGRLHLDAGVGFVVPDNKRQNHEVLIPPEHLAGAVDRQMVLVEIIEQPVDWKQPIGRITEVLGDHMAPGMETEVALRAHDIDQCLHGLDQVRRVLSCDPLTGFEQRPHGRDAGLEALGLHGGTGLGVTDRGEQRQAGEDQQERGQDLAMVRIRSGFQHPCYPLWRLGGPTPVTHGGRRVRSRVRVERLASRPG